MSKWNKTLGSAEKKYKVEAETITAILLGKDSQNMKS